MYEVKSRNRYRLGRVAAGPVSFLADGDKLTTATQERERVTFCASTYRTMLRCGWVSEVI